MALVSFTTIVFELLQTRVLSFIFWNHLVYLTISIALLGFGISGSLVALFTSKLTNQDRLLSQLLSLFGISTVFALAATYFVPVLGIHLSWFKVLFVYAIYLIPFIFSGAILSLLLSSLQFQVARLYAVDLLSAGIACIAFFFLLPWLEPTRLVGLIALIMGILAFLWASPLPAADKRLKFGAAIVAEAGLLVIIFTSAHPMPLLCESYKELFDYLSIPGFQTEKTVWTPLCRIDVIGGDKYKFITQDGSAHTLLLSTQYIADKLKRIENHTDTFASELAYEIKSHPEVAVIGVGGGMDIATGLDYKAKSIFAAELNPAIFDIVTRSYANYNGHLTADPRVKILNEEGRSALRQHGKKYDLIQIVVIDTFAALSSGAYVLSENYLYTVEAFQEFFTHLHDDGILFFERWNSRPPNESLRLLALGCEAWKRNGCKTIDQQAFVFMVDDLSVLLFRNNPFTQSEVDILKREAVKRNMQILYWPKILPKDIQAKMEAAYYQSEPPAVSECSKPFNNLVLAYMQGSEQSFFKNYPFAVDPTTDDSPFFFEYTMRNSLSMPKFDELRGSAASATLYIVLLESILLTIIAIFWPLWKFQRVGMKVPFAGSFSLYFTAVGVAFMLIEIGLVQKSVLFLGNPLYSLPVVLSSLLLSAGLGSWLIAKVGWSNHKLITVCGGLLILAILALAWKLNFLFYALMHMPLAIRMLVTYLVIFPIGVLMGTFFPMGLRTVKEKAASYIPWAWGINGCSSVYGSFAAILLAIHFSFSISLLVGALMYGIACLSALNFSKA